MPKTLEPQLLDAYTSRRCVNQPERYLVPIRDARLVGARGLVQLPDGSFAKESVNFAPPLGRDYDFLAPHRRKVVPKAGHYFSLVVHWSGTRNYYHWIHDSLMRLHGVLEQVPDDTIVIVPPQLRDFQCDSLRILGVPESRLMTFTGEETWELESLFFAPRVSNVGSDRKEADLWLRDRLLAGCDVASRSGRRRVFISRRNASQRRLVNEDEIVEVLEGFGFEAVATEELSLRDQIVLLSDSEALVSTHGAGLTNMLFAADGLVVVELIEPSMLKHAYHYWTMADQLNHDYWYLIANSVPRPRHQSDTHVPVAKLTATLRAAGLGT